MRNKKGQIALYLSFIIAAIFIVLITAVFAPMGTLINTKFYEAGEDILLRANESVGQINNQTVRDAYSDMISSATSATTTNIEVTTDLFQYAWILVVALTAIVAFLFTRRMIEYGSDGGFV
jgi:hypothetical protein